MWMKGRLEQQRLKREKVRWKLMTLIAVPGLPYEKSKRAWAAALCIPDRVGRAHDWAFRGTHVCCVGDAEGAMWWCFMCSFYLPAGGNQSLVQDDAEGFGTPIS